jgi:hypothetical protein
MFTDAVGVVAIIDAITNQHDNPSSQARYTISITASVTKQQLPTDQKYVESVPEAEAAPLPFGSNPWNDSPRSRAAASVSSVSRARPTGSVTNPGAAAVSSRGSDCGFTAKLRSGGPATEDGRAATFGIGRDRTNRGAAACVTLDLRMVQTTLTRTQPSGTFICSLAVYDRCRVRIRESE